MKLLYITKELPFGATEAFILPEIADHMAAGLGGVAGAGVSGANDPY